MGNSITIFLSETICSIRTLMKFWWNSHWMVLFQKCVRQFGPSTKMVPTAELSLTLDPMGNSHKNLLLRNHWANCNQTLLKLSLGGLLPKLYPEFQTSDQDGCHSRTWLNIGPYGKFPYQSSCLKRFAQ